MNASKGETARPEHLERRGGAEFVAVILAADAVGEPSVCGLTLSERARRVAVRAGANGVSILRPGELLPPDLAGRDLLVIRAVDQVVHTPLVTAAIPTGRRDIPTIAVSPNDGAAAGAMFVPAAHAPAVMASPHDDARYARQAHQWLAAGAAIAVPHGPIACHPAATRAERRGATHMLFGLVRKPQDSALIRHVNRRISHPLTRLMLPTPITPNAVSVLVFIVGALGCWFVAQPGYANPVIGTLLVLFAGYLDGCDGEIARLRLESSRFGAWLDTIVDETTTVLFLVAVGLHVNGMYVQSWIPWTIWIGAVCAIVSVYVIYYYLVTVADSCNSQDYPTESGGWLEPLRRVIKRDFINLAAVGLAVGNQVEVMYGLLFVGAVVSAAVLLRQHVALRMSGGVEPLIGRR